MSKIHSILQADDRFETTIRLPYNDQSLVVVYPGKGASPEVFLPSGRPYDGPATSVRFAVELANRNRADAAVLSVLERFPDGLGSEGIANELNHRTVGHIPLEDVREALSRLTAYRVVVTGNWLYKLRSER